MLNLKLLSLDEALCWTAEVESEETPDAPTPGEFWDSMFHVEHQAEPHWLPAMSAEGNKALAREVLR